MSFRDDEQLAEVCQALTEWMSKDEPWWNPAQRALTPAGEVALETIGVRSSGGRVVAGFAFALWGGGSFGVDDDVGSSAADLFYRLDSTRQKLIGSLLVAMAEGSDAIDAWLGEVRP